MLLGMRPSSLNLLDFSPSNRPRQSSSWKHQATLGTATNGFRCLSSEAKGSPVRFSPGCLPSFAAYFVTSFQVSCSPRGSGRIILSQSSFYHPCRAAMDPPDTANPFAKAHCTTLQTTSTSGISHRDVGTSAAALYGMNLMIIRAEATWNVLKSALVRVSLCAIDCWHCVPRGFYSGSAHTIPSEAYMSCSLRSEAVVATTIPFPSLSSLILHMVCETVRSGV